MKLEDDFYLNKNVLQVAKHLIGKIIVCNIDGNTCSARIVETEAYVGLTDKASHSYAGKRTQRNEVMYAKGGVVYMYICYGLHQMFNVVTNEKDVPDAVLIRAAEPVAGIEKMMQRTGKKQNDFSITRGPGNLCKAMGISKIHSGIQLSGNEIYILDDGFVLNKNEIASSKRIGIDGAGVDALLSYRFFVKGNKYVSGKLLK